MSTLDKYVEEQAGNRVRYTFFDLFAGIGGFRLGLERLGWICAGSCESDKYCKETYTANFNIDAEYFWGDVETLPLDNLPDFEVLTAGFPCQSFSLAGHRKGFEDSRGTLVYHIFKILQSRKPKAFILENVKGLVCEPFVGREFKYILKALAKLGYVVSWKILNSSHYNVPQNRERVFIVGFLAEGLLNKQFTFPKKIRLRKKLGDVLEKDVTSKYYLSKKAVNALIEHKKRHEEKGNGFGYSLVNEEGLADALSARYYKGGPENLMVVTIGETAHTKGHMIQRLREGDVMWTLNPANSKVVGLNSESKLRRLTPRECARLQGFPDSFKQVVSDTQSYKQFGNAVTVDVVEALGTSIMQWLDNG